MSKSQQTTDEATEQTTLDGDTAEKALAGELSGMSHFLWIAGAQLDDPDPVRVSTWAVRAKAEGML